MRYAIASVGLFAVAVAGGCSSGGDGEALSANAARWKAGSAVVVLAADVAPVAGEQRPDVDDFARRPGVISVSEDTNSLRIALSRQAELVDLATLKLDLENTPGITNVREVVVPPVP